MFHIRSPIFVDNDIDVVSSDDVILGWIILNNKENELCHEKNLSSGSPIRSDTNRAVQPQKSRICNLHLYNPGRSFVLKCQCFFKKTHSSGRYGPFL